MAFTNPRRTTKTTSSTMTPPSPTQDVKTTMPLRKSATFHSPSSTAELAFKKPSLPRRSQTTLEDVVEGYKRRAALTLGDIDRGLSSVDLDSSSPAKPSFRDEAFPVPQGFLNHTVTAGHSEGQTNTMTDEVTQEPADYSVGGRSLRPRRHIRRPSHYHTSDSGLGSSVMSGSGKRSLDTGLTSAIEGLCGKSAVASSAITRSAAAHKSTLDSLPLLTERATNKIREFILRPLLAKPSLKDFHSIVEDCPRKIHEKEIVCLRDLEKTLIFMAPVSGIRFDTDWGVAHWLLHCLKERSKTANKYLEFCLTSIRCIQATVEFLSEREQTRPHDRPYTNGYFVDLVDQIRNYAQQVQASKEKEEKGEPLDEMDVESSEEVKLYGGLTRNGRPAELVRVKKNGKAISIATGEQIKMESIEEDEKGGAQMKRSLSQEAADDEAILRSMARRKRSASAAELAPKRCREPGCTKEFKRSCDLTKHEKTHSRPWKCPEELCKYHEYGWPTEKELDRHINDKHSASPMLYKCRFAPCPYKSKRESNCKQHMEKSHNWVYVRSKNNGKNRTGNSKAGDSSLPTPQTLNHRTPDSSDSHEEHMADEDYDPTVYTGPVFEPPMYEAPTYPEFLPDDFSYENGPFISPVEPHNHSHSVSSSEHASPFLENGNHGFPIDHGQTDFDPNFGNGNDFTLYEDIYNARVQIPTPTGSIFQRQLDIETFMNAAVVKADPVPHISPGGHGNTMLYTPTSLNAVDDSFDHFEQDHTQLGNDFQLFSNTGANIIAGAHQQQHGNTLFGEIPSTVAGFSQPNTQEFFQAFYAPHNPTSAEWLQSDEGYSGGFDNQ